MPQQLVYTSAPRGIVAGRSGHCTVARSAGMRDALVLRLEQLSYYQHQCLGGAAEQPIFAHRIIDIRGARFHVLSRIQDAGLDFTGRTNFIAHHLAVTPEERAHLPSPPVILRDWTGWKTRWNQEPQIFENEDWTDLMGLARVTSLPAQTWQKVTGDAANGYGLLELVAGTVLRVNSQPDAVVLSLFAESLELLEVRDPRHDWRSAAWQFTFTTSLQEQDNSGEFRWRCVQGDAPSRSGSAESRTLGSLVAASCTDEEVALARIGRQPPRFLVEPENTQIIVGENARLQAKASGVPSPSYQWLKMDRDNNAQLVDGAIQPELLVANPPRGISRYALRVQNSAGEAVSRTVILSVELKSSINVAPPSVARPPAASDERYRKSAEEIEEQRQRLEAKERELRRNKTLFWKNLSIIALFLAVIGGGFVVLFHQRMRSRASAPSLPLATGVARMAADQKSPAVLQTTIALPSNQAVAGNGSQPQPLESSAVSNVADSGPNEGRGRAMSRGEGFNLPRGWAALRVGAVSATNSEYLPDERPPVLVLSACADGFDGSGDNVLFACHTNSQKEFSARLLSVQSPTAGSRCGIMVRDSQATDSAFLFIGASSDNLLVYRRDASGNLYVTSTNKPSEPFWLKIREENGRFAPSWSSDQKATKASLFDSDISVELKKRPLIGFALASGNLSVPIKARFAWVNEKSGARAINE